MSSEIKFTLDLSKVKQKVIQFPKPIKPLYYSVVVDKDNKYIVTVQLINENKILILDKEQLVEFFKRI